MFALGLMLAATFFQEVSASMGKKGVARRIESIYGMAFMAVFWSAVALVFAIIFLHVEFRFSRASLPYLAIRLPLEMLVFYFASNAVAKADRSTYAFLRLITIPLLLAVDIIVGYSVSSWQILGVLVVFAAVCIVLSGHKLNKRASGYVWGMALFAVATLSLYKYDITHFNSVAAEQLIVYLCLLAFAATMTWISSGENALQYLRKPWPEAQSVAGGVASVLSSFAYSYAPASVVVAAQRGLSLLWAVIFGNVYFHERHLIYKLASFGLVISGLGITVIRI